MTKSGIEANILVGLNIYDENLLNTIKAAKSRQERQPAIIIMCQAIWTIYIVLLTIYLGKIANFKRIFFVNMA